MSGIRIDPNSLRQLASTLDQASGRIATAAGNFGGVANAGSGFGKPDLAAKYSQGHTAASRAAEQYYQALGNYANLLCQAADLMEAADLHGAQGLGG